MKKYDIHIHTRLSDCADRKATIASMLSAAEAAGLSLVGFSDHAWDETVPGASDWYKIQGYKRLAARREELKELDTRGIKVLCGAEGEFANLLLGLSDAGAEYVDYVIVPHSHTHMGGFVLPEDCIGNAEKHARYLVKSLLALCRHERKDLFCGIAHPMFPVGCKYDYFARVLSHISDSVYDECAAAIRESDKMPEFNIDCALWANGSDASRYEYARFLDALKRGRNKMFVGSDAHSAPQLVQNHSLLQTALCAMSVAQEDLLTAPQLRIPNV